MKKALRIIGTAFAILIVLFVAYVIYMQVNYYRIEDKKVLEVKNQQSQMLKTNTNYKILSYNIGFGAYDQEFSFFMDYGELKDGTIVKGKYSKARSQKDALKNTLGAVETVKKTSADFILLQEVDIESTRCYLIDQGEYFKTEFSTHASTFANNFHSPYILYPLTDPHGSVQAGLLTLSKFNIEQAIRRSYPVPTDFLSRLTELDRCFSLQRLPLEDGKELVIINSHLSAYDKEGTFRKAQLELLKTSMQEEYKKGNYVIVGGDFNHALFDSEELYESAEKVPGWVFTLSQETMPEGFTIVKPDNYKTVPTCRNANAPYKEGISYTCILDGFIVSENVKAHTKNLNEEFKYSDHNPVLMTFSLQ